MAGHSQFANIKHRKGAQDAKKFVEDSNFNTAEIEKTYSWNFTKETFSRLYPEEQYY